MVKAIVLLSGGLDSSVATHLMKSQGLELEALNFVSVFCRCQAGHGCGSALANFCRELGIPLTVKNLTPRLLEILPKPAHGYGKNLNPCLDCRIAMFREARTFMAKRGASFLVSGEVLGQRPMSQRLDAMHIVDRDAGVTGLVLRPLSARVLAETLPEKAGWIDREKLLAIQGRSRKEQMGLAEHFSLKDYPCPAGGCLLTYPGFVDKVRDLLEHGPWNEGAVNLLKTGRHFRLSPRHKLIVGKNQGDNERLVRSACPGDTVILSEELPGPASLLTGPEDPAMRELALGINARYCDGTGPGPITLAWYLQYPDPVRQQAVISPLPGDKVRSFQLALDQTGQTPLDFQENSQAG